jgi:hypothetical protein
MGSVKSKPEAVTGRNWPEIHGHAGLNQSRLPFFDSPGLSPRGGAWAGYLALQGRQCQFMCLPPDLPGSGCSWAEEGAPCWTLPFSPLALSNTTTPALESLAW